MNSNKIFAFLRNPTFRIIATWVWWAAAAGLVLWVITAALGIGFSEFRTIYRQQPHLLTYVEVVGIGLFPLVLTLICRDDWAVYGVQRNRLRASLLWSAVIIITNSVYLYLTTGYWINWRILTVHVTFPANLWYAFLGIFAYGPLEMFFVIWLIANTEKAIRGGFSIVSWGLLVTVVMVGLAHIATASSIYSALYVTVLFLSLGMVFKHTGNSIGPMIAWTIINGQVWYLAQFLWS